MTIIIIKIMKVLNNIQLEKICAIDIETVRIGDKFENISEGFQGAWEYKNKIEGEIPEYEELCELWERSSALYAEFAKVCAVSLAYLDTKGNLVCKEFYGEDEVEILTNLKNTLDNIPNDYRLVGHSSKYFDYPFLCKRYIINGLTIPNMIDFTHAKPWEISNLDTNELWKMGGTGAGSSLKALCNVLNLESSKEDLAGDEVGKAYFKGELERIGRYCSYDTVATFNIVAVMKGMRDKVVNFENVKYIQVKSEKPKQYQTLLHELYETKMFNQVFKDKLKAHLKSKKIKKSELEVVKKLILASYLEKIEIGDREARTKEEVNENRTEEVKQFIKEL